MSNGKQRSGWHSTKLHLALIGIAVLTLAFVFVVWRTGSPAGFGEYAIGLVSLVGTYSASRVGETFAMRRRAPIPPQSDEPQDLQRFDPPGFPTRPPPTSAPSSGAER